MPSFQAGAQDECPPPPKTRIKILNEHQLMVSDIHFALKKSVDGRKEKRGGEHSTSSLVSFRSFYQVLTIF